MENFTLAIHGGAGTILQNDMTEALEQDYRSALSDAIDAGFSVLKKGGTSVEAVLAAVVSLEDNILFNAGRGSVFTKEGKHEMDASIMNGADLSAGAVSAVSNVRNPVALAHEIMQNSNHIYLCGAGAETFARKQGLRFEEDEYFFSKFRYDQLKAIQHSDEYALDHSVDSADAFAKEKKFGTVGAVACDMHGNIAAATSTGGMTNKQYGRVGDSPIIGAGTYANNKTCAISCTGHGEIFIQAVAAYDVSCLMEYKGFSLEKAMNTVTNDKLVKLGGEGGMIGVDAKGNSALVFNSTGMYRGVKNNFGLEQIAIYR